MRTKSSIDKVNAISAPAITPGRISGSVTSRKVCHGVAPRSRAASNTDSSIPASRARHDDGDKADAKGDMRDHHGGETKAEFDADAPSAGVAALRKNISSETPSRISRHRHRREHKKGQHPGAEPVHRDAGHVPSTVAIAAAVQAINTELSAACSISSVGEQLRIPIGGETHPLGV